MIPKKFYLKPKDITVIELLKLDYNQKQIAKHLDMTVRGIEKIVAKLKKTYGVNTLSGLIYQYLID